MLWRGATLALARRGVNVIRGDLRENWLSFFFLFFCGGGTDVIPDAGDKASFFLFEEAGESYGLIDVCNRANLK